MTESGGPRVPEATLGAAAQLLADRVGLRGDPAIKGRLARCLVDEARARRLDVSDYVARLASDPAAVQALLDLVTVQESAFFRDANQFAALAHHVVADLRGPVTVWSIGCANGQEPYSVAMVLAESAQPDWRVIASDISSRALARTRRGRYTEREMAGVSGERRRRHFSRRGAEWEVAPELRERVEVVSHNLAGEAPPFDVGACQVVLCRNVLIYVRRAQMVVFLERLARWLPADGWLFLGYSESLWQVTDRFELAKVDEAFLYRPRPDGPAPVAPRAGTRRAATVRPTPPMAPARRAAPRRARVARRSAAPAAPLAAGRADPAARPGGQPGDRLDELLAAGGTAMNRADLDAAVAAFRRAAYLHPDHPVAHLHLGMALEAAGSRAAARRAYAAARLALDQIDPRALASAVEGYQVAELVRLLDDKLEAPR